MHALSMTDTPLRQPNQRVGESLNQHPMRLMVLIVLGGRIG